MIAPPEVAEDPKLSALSRICAARPHRVVIAEWNYCLENVVSELSTEFVLNVRHVAAAMVAALCECYTIAGRARWYATGSRTTTVQLTYPCEQRPECSSRSLPGPHCSNAAALESSRSINTGGSTPHNPTMPPWRKQART